MSRQSRHGESLFENLCQSPGANIDAVLNKATNDEHGWDHVVDLTPQKQTELPADMIDHLLQCFVQIKTTQGNKPQTKIKLSNALKAAKSPNPCFIFLFHYEKDNATPILYGKKIWRDEIETYLKKAREISTSKKSRKINKVDIYINFDEDDIIFEHPSDWMFAKIKKHGGANYSTNKLAIVNSVGYGEFTHEIKFSLPSFISPNDIVSHELGLSQDIPITNIQNFDMRFGLPVPNFIFPGGFARLSISPTGRPVTIRLIGTNSKLIEIPASLITPSLIPLHHKEFKLRVDAGCLDIFISPSDELQRFKINLSKDKYDTFLQKVGLLCFLDWSISSTLNLELHCEQGILFKTSVKTEQDVPPWISQHARVAFHLHELMGPEKCNSTTVNIFEFQRNVKDMHLAAAIAGASSFRIEFELDNAVDQFSHLLGFANTQIGEWSVGAIYQFEHKIRENNGSKDLFYFGLPRIAKRFAFRRSHEEFRRFIIEEFKVFRQDFETPTAIAMGGDFTACARALETDRVLTLEVS